MDEAAEFSDWEVLPAGGGVSPKGFAAVRVGGAYGGGIDYDYFKVGKAVAEGEEGARESTSFVRSEVEGKGEVGCAGDLKSDASIGESTGVGEIFDEDLSGGGAVGSRRGEVSDVTVVADGIEVNRETEKEMHITETDEIGCRTSVDDNNRDDDVKEEDDLNGTGATERNEELASDGMECLESLDDCNNGAGAVIGGVGFNRTDFIDVSEVKSQGSRELSSARPENPEHRISESSNNRGDDAKEEVGLVAMSDRNDELTSTESRDSGERGHEERNLEVVTAENGENVTVAWWKAPFLLVKFCVFKVRPAWSMSIAAAVVGFVLLGRRLYNSRQKRHRLPLKLNLDEKKASQFVSRAARLNEAFSIVKRSPFIKATIPPSGIAPWPVLALR